MSEVKVNKISPRSGTNVQLGDSGDTITVPSGVTFDASSGGLAGTLTTAAQPNITSVGTLTSFTSTGIDDNATSTAITINSSEQVGIGTNSPDQLLHVKSTGNTRAKIEAGTASTFGQIYLGTENQFIIGYGSTHPVADALNLKNLNASGTIRFYNSGDYERMRIDSSGNVGIGTSSPSSALDIIGGLTVSGELSVDGNNNTIEHNITRQTGATAESRAVIKLTAKNTSSNVSDNFGSAVQFRMKDDTADEQLGAIGFIRNGADGAGAFVVGQDSNLLHSSPQFIVKSNGNVGIGETAPLGKLHIQTAGTGATSVSTNANELVIESTGNVGITLQSENTGTGNLYFGDVANGSVGRVSYDHTSNFMSFNTNASERMRISSNGAVGINSTATTLPLGAARFIVQGGSTSEYTGIDQYGVIEVERAVTGTQYAMEFRNPNGVVGRITLTGSATAYNTSSDYRLKENVNYDFDATTRLKQLKPARFNFIADADKTVDGFIAHEVQSVVPEAITGTHNEVEVWKEGEELPEGVSVGDNKLDGEGNTIPVYQGIDQAKLVPLLVKTIQELEARITQLENA